MKKIVTVKQIERLDRMAIKRYGVPSLVLMENAGRSVAEEILKCRGNKRVSIFCGLGNNAGDGFVVARHLLNAGVSTKIFLLGKASKLKNDARVNFQILKNCGYTIKEIRAFGQTLKRCVRQSDILVDAIFGVGLNRDIVGFLKSVIVALNKSGKPILAVDVPSGLDATTGKIYGVCIKAKKTVTFGFAKKGFFIHEGPRHAGKIVVKDIGIPEKIKKFIK